MSSTGRGASQPEQGCRVFQVEGTACLKAHRREAAHVLQRALGVVWSGWTRSAGWGAQGDEARGRQAQMVQNLVFQQKA